eukprot:TRINITY_DN6492_c0_g1_i1.p1 TRINITY_DN6492_c0_g1~~TRINITY_DN6492_c0_g1_i1.p1  ORF type:complete len:315 (-),score=66.76 TRINITY_DN6492_c0_g1_i1:25-969(-)
MTNSTALQDLFGTKEMARYNSIHFVLAGIYFMLFIFSILFFVRLLRHTHMTFSWQRFFHPTLSLGCIIRSAFFTLQPFIATGVIEVPQRLNLFLNLLPTYLFFACYLIILFLWAEIYHKSAWRSRSAHYFRPLYLGIVAFIFLVVFILEALDWAHKQPPLTIEQQRYPLNVGVYQTSISLFALFLYSCVGLGFLIYGLMVWRAVAQRSSFATESSGQHIKHKVVFLTVLINICFFSRIGLITWALIITSPSTWWWFDGSYFLALEVVPLVLMLMVLHSTPKRKQLETGNSSGNGHAPGETTPLVNEDRRTSTLS